MTYDLGASCAMCAASALDIFPRLKLANTIVAASAPFGTEGLEQPNTTPITGANAVPKYLSWRRCWDSRRPSCGAQGRSIARAKAWFLCRLMELRCMKSVFVHDSTYFGWACSLARAVKILHDVAADAMGETWSRSWCLCVRSAHPQDRWYRAELCWC